MKQVLMNIEKILIWCKEQKLNIFFVGLILFTFCISTCYTTCQTEKIHNELIETKQKLNNLDLELRGLYKEIYVTEKMKQNQNIGSLMIESPLIFPSIKSEDYLKPDIIPFMPSVYNKVTQLQGMRIHPITMVPDYHKGNDLLTDVNGYIISTMAGMVLESGYERDYGNYVIIRNGSYETLYAHLAEYYVIDNEPVQKGQIIGRQGNTGLSDGQHLHYEIRVLNIVTGSWECVDPFKDFFVGYLSQDEYIVVNNIYLDRGIVSESEGNRKE